MEELSNWLKANQLEKYQEILIENDINDLELLAELTEDDIKELGFSLGDRKRFVIGIKELENNSSKLSPEDIDLIVSLPYVIAYPLKRTLEEQFYWKKINLFKDTFLNYLKYMGLLVASEFFNSQMTNRKMVEAFQKNLAQPSFGTWNAFIRDCIVFLKENNHEFFCPELVTYYEKIEMGKKIKLFKGEIEYIDSNGDAQLKNQQATGIGMLINYRNRYLGHGLTLEEDDSQKIWDEYYPIFKWLLVQMDFANAYPMYKKEHGECYRLQGVELSYLPSKAGKDGVIWIENQQGQSFEILPFYIVPGALAITKEAKEQVMAYESYTGKTIKFFSPEGTEKQTSGPVLEKLNLLLRAKLNEVTNTPETFTKALFLNRIAEENKIIQDTLLAEKKIIPGVYQHREEMEIKLREWIGARANIFFIAAEAGSGKTNLLAEIQNQYAERDLPSLFIRAGRMEKQSLKAQIAYLLNIDLQEGLKNYTSLAGTQSEPIFILIDGLNEANDAEAIWQEILLLSAIFEAGSVKFVVTNRANTKSDIERYFVSDKENDLLYGENNENEKGLGAYAFWLTSLDMKEMKGAWENYVAKDKARFKPQFSFDDIAEFDRGIYNQIDNPLILRLFLEIYNGKPLPKKGNKHLHIWSDWLKTFTEPEQTFFDLLADAVWEKGENELLLDDVLKNEILKPYFTTDVINAPYPRLKNLGWISSYTKDLNSFIGFTVEGALLYLLGKKLQNQKPKIDLHYVQEIQLMDSKFKTAAIESFLCEEALLGNLDLVSEIIDAKGQDISIAITPLLLFLKTFGVKETIEKILEKPTARDWEALLKIDAQLEDLQLHQLRKLFLTEVMPKNALDTEDSVLLGLKAIAIFDKSDAIYYFEKINTNASFIEENAKLLLQLGDCEKKFGNYNTAIDWFQKCLNIQLKTLGEEQTNVATTYNNIGSILKSKGEYDKALEYYEKSLLIRLKTLGSEHPSVATSYNNIGLVWKSKGEYDKALRYYEKCLAIKLKALGSEHPSVATSYNNIGLVWKSKGEYDKALRYYEKCLAIKLKALGSEHPSVATSYNNIGLSWKSKGENDKALEYYEKCLSIDLKALGSEHPSVATSYNNIGSVWRSKGEIDKALEYYEKSLAIELKALGSEHPTVASSYNNIGFAWNSKGEYDKALEYYEKCLAIKLKALGSEHPSVATSYNNIGLVWKSKGEYDKALRYYEKCLAIKLKALGSEHPSVATLYKNIGLAWKSNGENDKALEYYEKRLSILLKTLGSEHPDVAVSYFDIGNINKSFKRFDLAIYNYSKGFSIDPKYGFPFNIAQCYEALNQPNEALAYYIQSAEIRKDDIGLDDAATKESIANAKRLAKELNKENELPKWII